MTEEQAEVIKRYVKFVRDATKKTLVSAYNSDLVQHFIEEYTGENLQTKLKLAKDKAVDASVETYKFLKPRVKLAAKKSKDMTIRLGKFAKNKAESVKQSDIYKNFLASKFVQKCKTGVKKASLVASIAGVMCVSGYAMKSHQSNSDSKDNTVAEKFIFSKNKNKNNSADENSSLLRTSENLLFYHIVHAEDFSDEPYMDSGGTPTIGYGTTVYPNGRRVKMSDRPISRTLSKEEIDACGGNIKEAMYAKAQRYVVSHLEKNVYPSLLKINNLSELTDNERVALGLFVYNVGQDNFEKSSVLSELKEGNISQGLDNMSKYNKVNGKFVKGLASRRGYEQAIRYGIVSADDVLTMPICSFYGDEIFNVLYQGKNKNDFNKEEVVIPDFDKCGQQYAEMLKQGGCKAVKDCLVIRNNHTQVQFAAKTLDNQRS